MHVKNVNISNFLLENLINVSLYICSKVTDFVAIRHMKVFTNDTNVCACARVRAHA